MGEIASQITSLDIVYSTVYSGADQSKHQSSASLAFVWGIHRGPVNSPHKWPATRKMFPFDDVIMVLRRSSCCMTNVYCVTSLKYVIIHYIHIYIYICVCLISTSLQTQRVHCYGHIAIRLDSYANRNGTTADGECCDKLFFDCRPNGCDPEFTICLHDDMDG